MSEYEVHGTVAEGFETVQEQFVQNFIKGIEENAQLCIYVGDNKVVDLWGTSQKGSHYHGDSVSNIFSSGKSLAAICMATLVDKQLLDYSDKIIKHWPEYGNGGKDKESMTVEQILRHEGGMVNFSKTVMLADIQTANIKQNSIGSIIEKEPLRFPPTEANTKAEYHMFTRGYILNEIFRRVDPNHRTIGECLREDISSPLNADAYIGLRYDELSKSHNLSSLSTGQVYLESIKGKSLGSKVKPNLIELIFIMKAMKRLFNNDRPVLLEHFAKEEDVSSFSLKFNYSVVKTGEIPSGNAQCSARGLAKVAAMMANKGKLSETRILSEETWTSLHSDFEKKLFYGFGTNRNFCRGGVNRFLPPTEKTPSLIKDSVENREGYIGWQGLGGSVLQWYPEYKIGFAYVSTLVAWEDVNNSRGALFQKKVLDCVKLMNGIEA